MSDLKPYLERKAAILAERHAELKDTPGAGVATISASSHVAGITGLRPVKMGDHIVTTDSGPGLAGHSLGPSSPELLLGALASCLTHTYVLQAALHNVPLDHAGVEVSGQLDLGDAVNPNNDKRIAIENLAYTTDIRSTASAEQMARLDDDVERSCAVLNTLRQAMPVSRN